ncbi:Notoamide biosynthesis cluster M'-like protein [Cladobotryum mycophilum]|uniref:Notoamide biosynthesis cluster M'-like protein n=1 Tax=Cladobotryum mycophilum TaxID=491253 RepID=A0ABR0T0S8_9HYPO
MSWTRRERMHEEFNEAATNNPASTTPQPRWRLDIWEITDAHPQGRWFAPLDLAQRGTLPQMTELFSSLDIPSEFSTERARSVSHSFGERSNENGFSAWFHFLCKNIDIKQEGNSPPEIDSQAASLEPNTSILPQADYSYQRSGFFLQGQNDGSATLVCFGPGPLVRKRLEDFVTSRAWEDVVVNPYILFDLVLEGLYGQVDDTVWNMRSVFGPLEHSVLELANSSRTKSASSKIPFTALHNCSKHLIHLTEAIESCLMVAESLISSAGGRSNDDADLISIPSGQRNSWISNMDGDSRRRREMVERQLKECLQYRRSLFRSTQLRLSSLQKRIDAAITLSFNLLTQQDSKVLMQDSTSMKIIAAITMVFLPTAVVAAVSGGQLFETQRDGDTQKWSIDATPLFYTTWWISIPLTVIVILLALSWVWWTHGDRPTGDVFEVVRRTTARTWNKLPSVKSLGRKKKTQEKEERRISE